MPQVNCWRDLLGDGVLDELQNRGRESDHRGSENDGDDAAGIDFQGQESALPAHHLPALDAFGVGDGNTALPHFHITDEGNDHHDYCQKKYQFQRAHVPGFQSFQGVAHPGHQADDDAGKDNQGNTVADAPFRYLFAQPHDEYRAGGQGKHGQQAKTPAGIEDNGNAVGIHPFQADGDAAALDQANKHGTVAGILGDFFLAQLAFLGDTVQVGPDHLQQLQNNRSADVGHDAQGENGHPGNILAGKHVHESEESTLQRFKKLFQGL